MIEMLARAKRTGLCQPHFKIGLDPYLELLGIAFGIVRFPLQSGQAESFLGEIVQAESFDIV